MIGLTQEKIKVSDNVELAGGRKSLKWIVVADFVVAKKCQQANSMIGGTMINDWINISKFTTKKKDYLLYIIIVVCINIVCEKYWILCSLAFSGKHNIERLEGETDSRKERSLVWIWANGALAAQWPVREKSILKPTYAVVTARKKTSILKWWTRKYQIRLPIQAR
ncbi:hypothetical protein RFI_04853 [Reticulomyxa filosa]|uniref:Uncharacterized protein n=1 Tax=Reticulomyxa filosa TaxID=46433 RepID=X6P298_RETFI|nr:hypothetical protein RFI_04853 [Reticulomyxa filosa]|eukprot:ETO32263.1 hypothetical protein RFI_04853 [Reticulomyxa filosa]